MCPTFLKNFIFRSKDCHFLYLTYEAFEKEISIENLMMRMRYYETFIRSQMSDQEWKDFKRKVKGQKFEVKGEGLDGKLAKVDT